LLSGSAIDIPDGNESESHVLSRKYHEMAGRSKKKIIDAERILDPYQEEADRIYDMSGDGGWTKWTIVIGLLLHIIHLLLIALPFVKICFDTKQV
jgi:hypothetical protein